MAYRVFISHSTRDIWLLDQLQNWLEVNGIETYVAELYPQPGQLLTSKIISTIESSDCVLAILTADGARSQWVNYEIGVAAHAERLVIPLLEEGVALPGPLQGREYTPFKRWDPNKAIDPIMRYLHTQKVQKESQARIGAIVLVTLGLLALAAAARRPSDLKV